MSRINPITGASKRGLMGAMNTAGAFLEAGMDFYNRRESHPDESLLRSAAAGALTYAEWALFPHIMWGMTLGELGTGVAKEAFEFGTTAPTRRAMRWGSGGGIGSGFQDSEKAYTARQRGLQAIQNSRMNARSALGNEARSLHSR